MNNNIIEFQEHDLKISGNESTIKELANVLRDYKKETGCDLPNTINDILFKIEVELNYDGLGELEEN